MAFVSLGRRTRLASAFSEINELLLEVRLVRQLKRGPPAKCQQPPNQLARLLFFETNTLDIVERLWVKQVLVAERAVDQRQVPCANLASRPSLVDKCSRAFAEFGSMRCDRREPQDGVSQAFWAALLDWRHRRAGIDPPSVSQAYPPTMDALPATADSVAKPTIGASE